MSTYNKRLVIFCNIYSNIVNAFSVIAILFIMASSNNYCFYIYTSKSILYFIFLIQFRLCKYVNSLYVSFFMFEMLVLLIICILSTECSENVFDVIYTLMSFGSIPALCILFESIRIRNRNRINTNDYIEIISNNPIVPVDIGTIIQMPISEKLIYDQETCSICLNKLSNNIIQLSCKHCFHQSCIGHWIEIKLCCPICKISLKI